jgi:hypothetical protein
MGVGHLLRDKHHLPFFSALRGSKGKLAVLDISRGQLENLADSHSTSGHQFEDQPVPGFDGTKDGLIHNFLFQNVPPSESWGPIELLQHRSVTGASEIGIEVFDDEVEIQWRDYYWEAQPCTTSLIFFS